MVHTQQTFVGLQDVLKTSWWHVLKMPLRYVLKTPSRHVLKMPLTRLQRNNFTSSRTSWRRLAKTSWRPLARRLEDALKDEKLLRSRRLAKTSWRRLEDVFKTSRKTSSRRLGRRKIVTLKVCWRHILKTYLEDVFKTSWRQTKCLLVISVSNKSKCVSNKSMFHKSISDKSKANPKCVT